MNWEYEKHGPFVGYLVRLRAQKIVLSAMERLEAKAQRNLELETLVAVYRVENSTEYEQLLELVEEELPEDLWMSEAGRTLSRSKGEGRTLSFSAFPLEGYRQGKKKYEGFIRTEGASKSTD